MVSIIIVNYNSSSLTCNALTSLVNDSLNNEIIVVDNSESSLEANKLRSCMPEHTKLIVPEKNLGFGKACNLAMSSCQGEYVFLLNPDTFLASGSIALMVEALEEDASIGAVSPFSFWDMEYRFHFPPSQMQSPLWEIYNSAAFRFGFFRDIFSEYFYKKSIKTMGSQKPVRQEMLSGGHIMVRKSILEEIGGLFDEEFFMYYEDTDLCLRITKHGYSLMLVPGAKVVHFWANESSKYSFQDISKEYFLKKHFNFLSVYGFIKRVVEKFKLKEPDGYTNFGNVHEMPKFSTYIDSSMPCVIELAFHYTFIPAIISFLKVNEKPDFDPIYPYLRDGEHWLRVRQNKKVTIFRWNLIKMSGNIES